jgi:hypothetical protein
MIQNCIRLANFQTVIIPFVKPSDLIVARFVRKEHSWLEFGLRAAHSYADWTLMDLSK